MKIIDKLIDKRDEILNGPDGASVAEANAQLAVDAIVAGINSTAWRTFMAQFVNNSRQLDRLVAIDDTADDKAMDRRRAYMLGNAVCGLPTGRGMAREVPTIDVGLEPDEPTDTLDGEPTPPRVVMPPL